MNSQHFYPFIVGFLGIPSISLGFFPGFWVPMGPSTSPRWAWAPRPPSAAAARAKTCAGPTLCRTCPTSPAAACGWRPRERWGILLARNVWSLVESPHQIYLLSLKFSSINRNMKNICLVLLFRMNY